MTLTPDRLSTPAEMPAIDPFWKDSQTSHEQNLDTHDRALIFELFKKFMENPGYFSEASELIFDNYELSLLAQKEYSSGDLMRLEDHLYQTGVLHIPTLDGFSVVIDGKPRDITIVAATEVADDIPNHGDMSSMLYLRDHIQAAGIYMEMSLKDSKRYEDKMTEGRTLLLSALHLMSTPSQLKRFKDVISRGKEAKQADWPHISLHFNDIEATAPDNGWRNKQDTFQMLAYTTLDAIHLGFIDCDELADAHKEFLGSVVPFLAAVGFPRYENSGSWEEIEARRTSVTSIETAVLYKIKQMIESGKDLGFLQTIYDSEKINLPKERAGEFMHALHDMITEGLQEIGKQLPYESPDYPSGSIKYREVDAALMYVLMYDIPSLLANEKVHVGPHKKVMTKYEIEALVLEHLSGLHDPETSGVFRYEKDSYQRVNFHTNTVQQIIGDLKEEVKKEALRAEHEIDLNKKQHLRDERTPEGKPAAWIHPWGQLAGQMAAEAIRAIERADLEVARAYISVGTLALNNVLANVTGDNQYHAVLEEDENGKKRYVMRQVPPNKLPECKVAYQLDSGEHFTVPSPHTPLNWASATLMHAVGLLRIATEALEKEERIVSAA